MFSVSGASEVSTGLEIEFVCRIGRRRQEPPSGETGTPAHHQSAAIGRRVCPTETAPSRSVKHGQCGRCRAANYKCGGDAHSEAEQGRHVAFHLSARSKLVAARRINDERHSKTDLQDVTLLLLPAEVAQNSVKAANSQLYRI